MSMMNDYAGNLPGFLILNSQDLAPLVEENIPEEYREEITGAIIQELEGLLWFTSSTMPYSVHATYHTVEYWTEDGDDYGYC